MALVIEQFLFGLIIVPLTMAVTFYQNLGMVEVDIIGEFMQTLVVELLLVLVLVLLGVLLLAKHI